MFRFITPSFSTEALVEAPIGSPGAYDHFHHDTETGIYKLSTNGQFADILKAARESCGCWGVKIARDCYARAGLGRLGKFRTVTAACAAIRLQLPSEVTLAPADPTRTRPVWLYLQASACRLLRSTS